MKKIINRYIAILIASVMLLSHNVPAEAVELSESVEKAERQHMIEGKTFPYLRQLTEEEKNPVKDEMTLYFVDEREFHCRGEFKGIHKGRPNEEDIKAAAEFARKINM